MNVKSCPFMALPELRTCLVTGRSMASFSDEAMKFSWVAGADTHPGLVKVPVWYIRCTKVQIKALLDVVRRQVPKDPVDLGHVKRVWPDASADMMRVLVCSHDCLDTPEAVLDVVGGDWQIQNEMAPRFPARTKEEAGEWSTRAWPILWRGNPAARIPELTPDETVRMMHWIDKLRNTNGLASSKACSGVGTSVGASECSGVDPRADLGIEPSSADLGVGINVGPSVGSNAGPSAGITIDSNELLGPCSSKTLVVNPETNVLVAQDSTQPSDPHPLHHSVMKAIESVATRARNGHKDGPTYLCTDAWVFTQRDPCVMCTMALVHSRIGRLVYLDNDPLDDGGIGRYALHARRQLNHTFQVWRYHHTQSEQLDTP